ERHRRGGDGELGVAVGPAGLLRPEPRRRVPPLDHPRSRRRGGEEAVPERVGAHAAGRDDADAGDRDATTAHAIFGWTRSYAWPTVSIPSSGSAGIAMPDASSNAITSSTRSRLSASRSSPDRASTVTWSGATGSTSAAHLRKGTNVSSAMAISLVGVE